MKPLMPIVIALAFAAALRCHAQADFTPENPPEMTPLHDPHSPAYRTAQTFRRGANLGNYLEAWPKGWKIPFSADELKIMKEQGFDHVRVPVGWHHYAGPGPDFVLSSAIFAQVDYVVTNALAAGLAVMINIHHFNEMDRDPAAAAGEFIALWRQIAEHYRAFPAKLVFELDNEPHENATTALMNPIYARTIAEIRKTNPDRTIVVEPGGWGSISELKNLVLPPDDNVMVSVHCYDPFFFTHQGATWAGAVSNLSGIHFPGPPAQPVALNPKAKLDKKMIKWIRDYNTLPAEKNPCSPRIFEQKLKYIHEWSDYYGRPVHLGEFGCFTTADPDSRARFYSAFRRACDKNNIGWAIWDWSAGFRYWDRPNHRPMPGMREALFGR